MAKSRSIGGIYASLTLRDGGFRKGIAAARKELNAFGGRAAKGLAVGMGVATASLGAGTLRTLDQVDALGDLSAQTGVAVADMMKLQRAYKDGGREASMAGKDIGKMQKSLFEAASGGKDPFKAIGLSAQELLKMNPAAQFETIGDAIMRIENPAERTAKAMEIFGKGGMGLTTIFPGLKDAEKTLGRMPELAQQFAGAMGEANDLIGRLPVKSDQFFTGFTAGIIGELLPNLQKIDNYDFTNIGQSLGRNLATAMQAVTDGSAWELFTLQAEKALATIQVSPAFNGLAAGINAILDFGATGEWEFSKYMDAGLDANIEKVDELQAKIDALNGKISGRFQEKSAAAAAISAPVPIVNPIRDLAANALAAKAEPADPMAFANDYQRRGLSLDSNGGAASEDKNQTKLLGEVRDLLKRIADSRGPLVWGKG